MISEANTKISPGAHPSPKNPLRPLADSSYVMTAIICLAHYCDIHGPTPLMVTEGLPQPCSICFDDADVADVADVKDRRTVGITDTLGSLKLNGLRSASDKEAHISVQTSVPNASDRSPATPIDTPPDSPNHTADQSQSRRNSSNFRRTYDDLVTKRASPCENCAMTIPQDISANEDRGPTLRTRFPWAQVYNSGEEGTSPPPSQASSASDTDGEGQPSHPPRRTPCSSTTRSSISSTTRSLRGHTHYMNYTSTHEPLVPNSFSVVRASCLRALSFETLPRTPHTGSGGASNVIHPQAPPNATSQPFVTTHSAGAAASGGPIFFGDPQTGYTIAYIFRIPDVHARGHKRVYAFLALSTHKERLFMKLFGFIATAFREMASWIQKLAEAEAEKAAEASPVTAGGGYFGGPTQSSQRQSQDREKNRAEGGYGGRDHGSGSSFLTGGSALTRRMGTGGGPLSLKSRGLAELVGLPDFFVQLHEKFVWLLMELSVRLDA
ncbi:hypothetical protein SODALDRAFT_381108 [Sodiomyces alkalinus F11]|uniref:UDENN FLCN/SMCR8-type domain-containing protein n=1 Tax=Sodiomyces alkalinus (strain CBS 110278 / VKM F-3762 / F11) TaxID=1314773 RepID=A0A3N2PN19_SODAK|nr:hypothetical protein SODALDRAFT_381108 [Sodiomyces alkalinus F11]ROT35820.1 hypothetical protein SODALDRAFT_381108 [Sodiomyces alkalinus F11]